MSRNILDVVRQCYTSSISKFIDYTSNDGSIDNSGIISEFTKYFVMRGIIGGVLIVGLIFILVFFTSKLQDEMFIEDELKLFVLGVKPTVN